MRYALSIIETVIGQMQSQPRFIADSWENVVNANKGNAYDKTKDGTRYPLIVCNPMFEERRGIEIGVKSEITTDFYIVAETKKEWTPKERIDNVYTPILSPLFDEMIYTMYRSGKIEFNEINPIAKQRFINCTTENLYYAPNNLNDIVDALKVNITLKIR